VALALSAPTREGSGVWFRISVFDFAKAFDY